MRAYWTIGGEVTNGKQIGSGILESTHLPCNQPHLPDSLFRSSLRLPVLDLTISLPYAPQGPAAFRKQQSASCLECVVGQRDPQSGQARIKLD